MERQPGFTRRKNGGTRVRRERLEPEQMEAIKGGSEGSGLGLNGPEERENNKKKKGR